MEILLDILTSGATLPKFREQITSRSATEAERGLSKLVGVILKLPEEAISSEECKLGDIN